MESSESMLESINHGANQVNLSQIFPMSGNVQNSAVGTNNAVGRTIFQWAESAAWWSPINSYFYIRLQFRKSNSTTGGIVAGDYTTYCDNFIMTLFNSVQIQVGDQPLELVNTPWIVDTALTYSKAENNFLKTYGSLTRVGESLATRMNNVIINQGYVDVVFRPPVSLFDVAALPPGVQFQVFFNWNSSSQLAWESLIYNPVPIGPASGKFDIFVQSFSFYKASISMSPEIPLKPEFAIDLWPATAIQYPFTSMQSIQQNIVLPSTTNKLLIVFQDTNNATLNSGNPLTLATATNTATGVGGGYNPATSFSNVFTTSGSTSTTALAQLTQLWLQIPEIGYTGPKPQYVFDANLGDMQRAYSDWAHGTQGTCLNSEGSVPFGNGAYTTVPITWIVRDALPSSVIQSGDPANNQAFPLFKVDVAASDTPVSGTFNQTSRWGWVGRVPGPIFCFPVVRPDDKTVSIGTLYANFAQGFNGSNVGTPASVTATVISQYNTILSFEHAGAGLYRYKFYS